MAAQLSLPSGPPAPAQRPAQHRRPDLWVVEPVRHTGRYTALLVLVAVVGVLGVVSLNALAAESAFIARELATEVDDLSMRYTELTAEVAALEAPEHIHRVATEELGMVRADSPAYLETADAVADHAGDRRGEGEPGGSFQAPPHAFGSHTGAVLPAAARP